MRLPLQKRVAALQVTRGYERLEICFTGIHISPRSGSTSHVATDKEFSFVMCGPACQQIEGMWKYGGNDGEAFSYCFR